VGWLVVTAVGIALALAGGHLRYLGLLLLWIGPPMAVQRAVAGDLLRARRRARLVVALPCALWLCAADRLALADGIWAITPASSTGVLLLGLPLEEALFFVLTCCLVADGLLLAPTRVRGTARCGSLRQPRRRRGRSARPAAGSPSGRRHRPARGGDVGRDRVGHVDRAGLGLEGRQALADVAQHVDSRTPRARQMLASSSDDASF
jgi:lycopene cyclase domain-containing protein